MVLPADAIVGQENDGWAVATNTLGHERTTAILSRHASTTTPPLLCGPGRPGGVREADRDLAVAAWIELSCSGSTGTGVWPPR